MDDVADPRFRVLFEPVKIGPVTAPNRFYQVPHCTGMGYSHPMTLAAMREIKAEGGWGVVNTEYCSIHPSSDDLPAPFCSLWDDGDIVNMAAMADGVHRHGALAGVELWYGGQRSSNNHSRLATLSPVSMPVSQAPWQSQRMDLADIRTYRGWHRDAARRARTAGFDIVYVYAAHTYLLGQFLDPAGNRRSDDYGGSFANRTRLLREVLEETCEEIGQSCAVALRIEVLNEDGGGRDERSELLQSLSPLVDLFDVTIPDYAVEMGVSRFVKEGSLETHVAHVKALTGKPVVSVGRFTSPETMLGQIRRGVLDFIGAARPSIADPFLPSKIRHGAFDDIRECIGCNVCYAMDGLGVPIRCTQNPTMGEEWRRGWHPERVNICRSPEPVLIVGSGPAGLEAAITLGKRGVPVLLAEAENELGGRVTREARLPGLSEWARVRDWRVQQLSKLPAVEIFRGSRMTRQDVIDTGVSHVVLAAGSRWRSDGLGRSSVAPIASFNDARVFTPDRIMTGERPSGPVVIFDDEHYYMASCLAELLAREGHEVTFVTSGSMVAPWTSHTMEQARIQASLLDLGVTIIVSHAITGLGAETATLTCLYSGASRGLPCGGLVSVTSRQPEEELWHDLQDAGLASLSRIGDCKAPGLIAQAVYDGHAYGENYGLAPAERAVRRERVVIGA
ncbi:FAD-dependent oxidoreductase [Aestuariivirga sp.]|uniref:oxidoreductase n=1 Tax=Aestuariivirga sp. TaxID=2650926 RepID=UPI0039E3FD3F